MAIYVVKHDGRIEIGVKDSGAGLSEAQQQLLLQPFASMDDKYEREFGAAGLGIKITRRLIEAMGSQLQIESSPGTGSRFFFELAQDAEHSDAFDWKPPQAMQDLSVAIVSPLALQRRSIINMMSHWKIAQVHEHDFDVENGGEPAELEPCDLVIVDQSETEQAVNGFIDKLRNQSAWRDTRFVHLVPQNRESEGGSADVRLLKPLSHSRLYTMMMDTIYKQAFSNEYDPVQARAEETGPDKTGKLSGRRILLAEDNDINKMIVLEMLEDTGVDVDVATNGAEAVEQVQREDYDLVLMDIQMPVVDGYEATRRIRALGGWFESIPIVAMTAHALEGDSGKSLEAGMDQHVSKPFEPDELIDLVADLVQQRRRD